MLFWIALVFLALGIAAIVISHSFQRKADKIRYNDEYFKISSIADNMLWCGIFIAVIAGILTLIMSIEIFVNAMCKDAEIRKYEERYAALNFKIESPSCKDEFGLLNKSVIDEVQRWNEDLAEGKAKQRNFWYGILVPNIYDQFDYIDYERITP